VKEYRSRLIPHMKIAQEVEAAYLQRLAKLGNRSMMLALTVPPHPLLALKAWKVDLGHKKVSAGGDGGEGEKEGGAEEETGNEEKEEEYEEEKGSDEAEEEEEDSDHEEEDGNEESGDDSSGSEDRSNYYSRSKGSIAGWLGVQW